MRQCLHEPSPIHWFPHLCRFPPCPPNCAAQKREPFNPWSLLKSPVGIMVVIMVVGVFLMPILMDNMGEISSNTLESSDPPHCQPSTSPCNAITHSDRYSQLPASLVHFHPVCAAPLPPRFTAVYCCAALAPTHLVLLFSPLLPAPLGLGMTVQIRRN